MNNESLNAVYLAQLKSSLPLKAQSQRAIYRFAERHREIDLLAKLADRAELEPAIRKSLASRSEPLIKIAYLSRNDVSITELASSLAVETRSGVLAGLVSSARINTDRSYAEIVETIVISALKKSPTRVLAEAVVINDSLHLDLRLLASSFLGKCESLPVSVVNAIESISCKAYVRSYESARKIEGVSNSLKKHAIFTEGLDSITRIDLLQELIKGFEYSNSETIEKVAAILEDVDDLQEEVLDFLHNVVSNCVSKRGMFKDIILERIENYSGSSKSERRLKIAAASIQAQRASTPGEFLIATEIAFELKNSFIAETLLSNKKYEYEYSKVYNLMKIIAPSGLLRVIKNISDDRYTTCAYLIETSELVLIDGWSSCVNRSEVQQLVAKSLREEWERSDGCNQSELLIFASSGVEEDALVELPWEFFCSVASSFEAGAHSDWIARSMGYIQDYIDCVSSWETFEDLGKNFSGSLSELASVSVSV
jgi:hypothetical protein